MFKPCTGRISITKSPRLEQRGPRQVSEGLPGRIAFLIRGCRIPEMREGRVYLTSHRRNGRQIDRRQGEPVRVVSLCLTDMGEDGVRRVVVAS